MKKLLVTAIFVFSILSSAVSYADEWKQDSTGWKYVFNDGTFVKDMWFINPGTADCYHFDSNGYMQSGIVNINEEDRLFNESGVLQRNKTLPDGRRTSDDGKIFSDVNDGVTFMLTWLTDTKVGNSKNVAVAIRNICDKPITLKKQCNLIRNDKATSLYLYDPDAKSFYEEKTINPNEMIGVNYIDKSMSDFYTDESATIDLVVQVGNKLYSCPSATRTPSVIHTSAERLQRTGYTINQ